MDVTIRHNMEIAHRLSLLPGKCQQIHGHSMKLSVILAGEVNENGIMGGMDFSLLKKQFRGHIDEQYDHQLHLNATDEWAQAIYFVDDINKTLSEAHRMQRTLPGLVTHPGDPTVENLTKWIAEELMDRFPQTFGAHLVALIIDETSTNSVMWHRLGDKEDAE